MGDATNGSQRRSAAAEPRIPPQAVEVEMSVLGAMLLQSEAAIKGLDLLSDDVFYKEAHQKIFRAMQDLHLRNEPIDHITVTEELRRREELEPIGGAFYITSLSAQVTSTVNVENHCRILLEKSLSRQLIGTCVDIINDGYQDTQDAFDLLDSAESGILRISERHIKRSYVTMERAISDVFELIDRLHQGGEGFSGVPTGYTELDQYTGGLQPSDLIILAARPSVGKTALALSIARNVAVLRNMPVAVFSLEMSVSQLALRLLCSEARVNLSELRRGKFRDDEDWKKLSSSFHRIAKAKIFIDDTPALTILELRAKARRLKHEHGIGLIVVDYLQLMHAPRVMESREREISMISRSLKALAKDLEIPVLALSQLNRGVEQRTDKRPQLSDLRESGSIEQDADVVMFIHREKEEDPSVPMEQRGEATIIIGKQRNGPTGEFRLAFLREFTRFENLEEFRQPDNFFPTTPPAAFSPF